MIRVVASEVGGSSNCDGVWCHGGFVAVGVGEPATVLVLYYIEYVQGHMQPRL